MDYKKGFYAGYLMKQAGSPTAGFYRGYLAKGKPKPKTPPKK